MTESSAAVDARLMQVAALLDSDPRAAADEAAQILVDHPGHPVTTLLLGTARRSLGDPDAAGAFRDLAVNQPDSALIQLELGQTLRQEGKTSEALAALQRAIELEPNLAEAWREMSMIEAARGNTAACDTAYDNFTRLADPEKHLAEAAAAYELLRLDAADLARTLFSQQKAEPILPLIARLLDTKPDDLLVRSLQASAYSLLGLNDRAVEILTRLITEHPQNERVWLAFGHALRFAGRFNDAVGAYRRSAELRPEFGEAYFSLANLETFRFTQEDIDTMEALVARRDRLQP